MLGTRLLFASEIKSILGHPGIDRKVNEDAFIITFLFFCVHLRERFSKGSTNWNGHYLVIQDVDNIMNVTLLNMFKRRNEEEMARTDEDVCQEILELFRDGTS